MKNYRRRLFERLPNEILIEIFSYLNDVDSVYAFSKLNQRFDCLLNEFCISFDLQSIGKKQFDLVNKLNYLKQCKALQISDDDRTPNLINNICLTNDFYQLESLSILNLNIRQTYPIISMISSIQNLVYLKIQSICGEQLNGIEFPNLRKLSLTSCTNINWIENLDRIESIELTSVVCQLIHYNQQIKLSSNLKHLKIIYEASLKFDSILDLLTNLSSLLTLEIYEKSIGFNRPNGQVLQNRIHSSLPMLKTLKFFFQFYHVENINVHKQIIDSFSSPFYLNEKQWFITHDIPFKYPNHFILLNSFHYAFREYLSLRCSFHESITTVRNNSEVNFYSNMCKHIQTLAIRYQTDECYQHILESNIINLTIYVEFNLKNYLPILTKLQYLYITCFPRISSKDFQCLLKNAPYLKSLCLNKTLLQQLTNQWTDLIICNLLSEKIQYLKLIPNSYHLTSLSQHQLKQIIQIFKIKCQHLSIPIQSIDDDRVNLILQNMSQLRCLHIKLLDSRQNKCKIVFFQKENDLYFWL